MEFLKLLFNRSKLFYFSLALLGMVNGVLNISLLMFVNNAINPGNMNFLPKEYGWAVFLGLVLLSVICSRTFQTYMIRLTNRINFDFEMNILQKVRNASYPSLQKLGNEKVITAVNDVRTMVHVPEVMMNAVNAVIIVACCFIYLFYISWAGALVLMGMMSLLLVFYLVRNKSIERDLNEVRTLQNRYYRYLSDLLLGFKEIKVDDTKNRNLYDKFFLRNRTEARQRSLRANIRYMTNELTGNYSWYLVIGLTLFVIPLFVKQNAGVTSSFLVTILYLIGPVAVLITLIPTYTNVKIALQRLTEFNNIVNSSLTAVAGSETPRTGKSYTDFETISYRDIVYEYTDGKNNKTFQLGPVSLDIKKGEILYITGSNGSGKSTFMNILSGLYKPLSGTVLLDGKEVPAEDIAGKHQMIAAVFASPHLFTENYNDFPIDAGNQYLQELLRQLELSEKARFENDTISPNLSKGQQKRLALIMALMEEKPLLVLDEWAADQDPAYRRFFYYELLPLLQSQGKTIVAITHDEQYYQHGNRIVRFDYGQIAEDLTIQAILKTEIFN